MRYRITLAVLLVSGLATILPLGLLAGAPPGLNTAEQSAIEEAATWIGTQNKIDAEYRYVMTCKVRLVFFWAGSDDVGGGYVRIGKAAGDDRQQMIQILFGSDPSKAPLAINRWGGGTEVVRGEVPGDPPSSAFFGFMKSSKGQSVLAMKSELSKEKANGTHLFEGIMSRVDDGQALATSVPYTSNQDLDLHQYAEAEKATLQQLENNPARHIKRLDGAARQACPRSGEFLSTILQLNNDAVAGHSTPESLCYIYNARHYQATLLSVQSVKDKAIHVNMRGKSAALDQTYHNLKDAHFEVACQETGTKSTFDVVLGVDGKLRGAPIQINYQPNWWFQVVLNLLPETSPSIKANFHH
jgi:hypothetical protein